MSNPLANQITVWWQSLTNKDTLNTYQSTLQITWNILRETAKLLWLFLCLTLVLFGWLWSNSFRLGTQAKAWYETLDEPKAANAWTAVGKFLLESSQNSANAALGQARDQLGLPALENKPAASMPASVTKTKPAAAKPDVPEPQETAAVETEA